MNIGLAILGAVLLLGALLFVCMMIAAKIVYGGWLMFPWTRSNPYNVKLREIDEIKKRLDALEADDPDFDAILKEIHLYGDFHRFLPLLAHRQGFSIAECALKQSAHDTGRMIEDAVSEGL